MLKSILGVKIHFQSTITVCINAVKLASDTLFLLLPLFVGWRSFVLSLPLEGPRSYDHTTIWRWKSVFKCKSGSCEKHYCTSFEELISCSLVLIFAHFFVDQTVIVEERADLQTCTISREDHELFFYIKEGCCCFSILCEKLVLNFLNASVSIGVHKSWALKAKSLWYLFFQSRENTHKLLVKA